MTDDREVAERRHFLAVALADEPGFDPEARARMRARLLATAGGATVSAGLVSKGTAASKGAAATVLRFATHGVVAKAAGGVALVLAASGGVLLATEAPSLAPASMPRAPARTVQSTVVKLDRTVGAATRAIDAPLAVPAAPTTDSSSRTAFTSVAPAARRPDPVHPASELQHPVAARTLPDPRGFAEELGHLDEARRALSEGRPAAAMAALRKLDATDSVFKEEREALGCLALCASGNHDDAQNASQRFAQAFPRSMHRPKIERVCAMTVTESSHGGHSPL
jgi:hypothetical protein